jgi:RNA polymerase sigma-70 factor (ECF subfamily)
MHLLLRGIFGLTPVPPSTPSRPGPSACPTASAPGADAQHRRERDAELVRLLHTAAAGNANAFERLYEQTIGYVHAMLRRMLPQGDVDDVVAELYFQAWRDLASFDAQRGGAVTWLLTIARSRALDLLRHRKASPEVDAGNEQAAIDAVPPDTPGPVDLLASMQANTRLHQALSQLSAQERWVLGLAYYRELTHREVAEATGLPLGSVKSLILRSQAKLRTLLAESTADIR